MAEAARVFSFRRRAESEQESEKRALKEGLAQTRTLISQAYAGFNSTHDPDLIESYVFEINSLQARYSYLLRRVKEMESCGGGGGMTLMTDTLPWLLVGLLAVGVLALLGRPLKHLLRLCLRTGVGLAALAAFSPVGGLIGVSLGVNLANALVMGLLGVPGFGLLLMLHWALAL